MSIGIVIGLCLIPCAAAAIAMGMATAKGLDAIARQPEASGKINATMILGLALIESTAIYGFVTALILIFTQ